jgi:hypothetical protein
MKYLKELLDIILLEKIMQNLDSSKELRMEFYDQDDWEYELSEVKVCQETNRIIFGLNFIGEKNGDQKINKIAGL